MCDVFKCSPSPVRGGYPLGPGATKGSNSGISVESELELEMGSVLRPWFVTLGRFPVGAGGGEEGIGAASLSDMVLIVEGG